MTIKEKWALQNEFAKNYFACDPETRAIIDNADDTYPNRQGTHMILIGRYGERDVLPIKRQTE